MTNTDGRDRPPNTPSESTLRAMAANPHASPAARIAIAIWLATPGMTRAAAAAQMRETRVAVLDEP